MTDFPLLRLPLLPQLEILNNMDIKEICFLSMLSERSKTLVRSAKRSIENLTVYTTGEKISIIVGEEGHNIVTDKIEHHGAGRILEAFQKVGNVSLILQNVENIRNNVFWNYTKSLDWLVVLLHKKPSLKPEDFTFLFKEVAVSELLISAPDGFTCLKGFTQNPHKHHRFHKLCNPNRLPIATGLRSQ